MTAVSAVEAALAHRRRRWRPVLWLILAAALFALIIGIGLIVRVLQSGTPYYSNDDEHFRYGSIGAEVVSGIPYKVWQALPVLFPEEFPAGDYSSFGFLYDGTQDLPIGISKRRVSGVDLVWFNCAVCHAGTYRASEEDEPQIVTGMPAHQLDLHGFTTVVLGAASDPRMGPDSLRSAMADAGVGMGPIERHLWNIVVFPRLREGMIARASRLQPLLERQPNWGYGRVDTFNPY